MKKIFVLSVIALLSAVLYAGEPFAKHTFPSASITALEVNNIAGNITLTGTAGDKATVEVFVSGNNRMNDNSIKEMLNEYYTIDVHVAKEKLFVVVKHKKQFSGQQELSISFNISVPGQVSGKISSASGHILISETSGDLYFTTASGHLVVDRVSGKIFGSTASGNIKLTNSTDNVSLSTASGNIQASNCEGSISLATASGNVVAENIIGALKARSAIGNIKLKNISGNLKIIDEGESSRRRNIRRNIDVTMESVNEYVTISNNSRNVNLTLPANHDYNLNIKAEKVKTSGLRDFRGKMDRETLNGSVGSGGAKIEISRSQQVGLSFK
ncbi:MAG: DUF4097 domain-containing protein [Prevotellaceae bacterium]|jgi:hypothetical protein|nr:DUF4097 domain-containing protein [Prevotellaceae bacterium]